VSFSVLAAARSRDDARSTCQRGGSLARSTINRVVRGGKRGNGRFTRTTPAGIYGRTAQFPHDMNHRDAPVSLRYEGPRRARRRGTILTSFLTSAPTRASSRSRAVLAYSRSLPPLAATGRTRGCRKLRGIQLRNIRASRSVAKRQARTCYA